MASVRGFSRIATILGLDNKNQELYVCLKEDARLYKE